MANQDLLLHDAKNCLHALTVNLEAMEDGLIPLDVDAIRTLNRSLLTFLNILLQFVREIAPATSVAQNAAKTTAAAKRSSLDVCSQAAPSQHLKAALCKEAISTQPPMQDTSNIVPVMRRLVNEMVPLFHKEGIAFSFEIEPAEVWVHVDVTNFERMVRNLFSNEEKYVFFGGKVEGTLEMRGASQAYITLIDNGPGINPSHLKNIFNHSQRGCVPTSKNNSPVGERPNNSLELKATGMNERRDGCTLLNGNNTRALCKTHERVDTEIPEGSGLGLYQVAQTIASMGGTVEVDNCATGGLKTVLSFPADAFLA